MSHGSSNRRPIRVRHSLSFRRSCHGVSVTDITPRGNESRRTPHGNEAIRPVGMRRYGPWEWGDTPCGNKAIRPDRMRDAWSGRLHGCPGKVYRRPAPPPYLDSSPVLVLLLPQWYSCLVLPLLSLPSWPERHPVSVLPLREREARDTDRGTGDRT